MAYTNLGTKNNTKRFFSTLEKNSTDEPSWAEVGGVRPYDLCAWEAQAPKKRYSNPTRCGNPL